MKKKYDALMQRYVEFNNLWESNRFEALRKLDAGKMVTTQFYEFTARSPMYLVKFHFHLVYDRGSNIPHNIDEVMTMMEEPSKYGFESFIQYYMELSPTFPLSQSGTAKFVSFEAPILGGEHIIGILLETYVECSQQYKA
jgi:hypothetical protein